MLTIGQEELADWRAGRDAIYELAALTVGARPSPAAKPILKEKTPAGEAGVLGYDRLGGTSIGHQANMGGE